MEASMSDEAANDACPDAHIPQAWQVPKAAQWVLVERDVKGTWERCSIYDEESSVFVERLPAGELGPDFILSHWGSGKYRFSFWTQIRGKNGLVAKALGRS